jgi:GT2 family glycosyltransferase
MLQLKVKNPWVTIIVLNYNGLTDTRACINSVLKTKYPNYRILLIDNGSKQNEAEILKKEFTNKKVLFKRFNTNLGFTGALNKVAEKIFTKYIVFLNNDTLITPDWLNYLVNEAQSDNAIAACGSKVLLMDSPKEFDYSGAAGGFIDKYGYPFTRGRIFYTTEKDEGQFDKNRDIFWVSGVCMLVRRKFFTGVGMFDNSFFIYMEEIDICWRFLQMGYKIRSVPKSVIYHKVAATARRNMFAKIFYEHRNNLIMITKNFSNHDLLVILPRRVIFEILSLLYYLACLNFNSFFALISAHLSFMSLLPGIIIKRTKKLKNIVNFSPLVLDKSIVIMYFIFKKNKFSQVM